MLCLLSSFALVALVQQPIQLQFPNAPSSGAERITRSTDLADRYLDQLQLGGELNFSADLGWSQTAERVLFEYWSAGYPIRGEGVKVVMFRKGGAIVEGNLSQPTGQLPQQIVSAATVESQLADLAQPGESIQVLRRKLAWQHNRLVWEIYCRVDLGGDWHEYFLFDAADGEFLLRQDLRILRHAPMTTGTGQVFDPNPVQTSGDHGLKDSNDSNSAVPSSEYRSVSLLELSSSGYLDGPYCSTSPTSNRIQQTNFQFVYQRNADAFEEVMCYYHIDMYQRYLQAIGQMNANNRVQKCDVNGYTGDNSWYDLGSREITYGSGGVDDAEDADIILHEYGHALHHDVQGGIGNGQNGSMSEGYGDYFAASFYDDALVGEWDAVSYTGGPLHYLRRVDEDVYYPGDLGGGVHSEGQIWAAMLWDLRAAIGREIADNIIVEAMSLQSNSSGMISGGNWLLTAELQLYGGDWRPYIEWALHRRGIRDLGASAVVLSPTDSTPIVGQNTVLSLAATNYPGRNFQALASLQPGPFQLGPPHNVTLHVALDLLSQSLGTPAMAGSLNGAGQASITLQLPAQLLATPINFQAAVLNSAGAILELSTPCAVRMGPN
jgi:fungalysin metallopeptidase (M36)